MKKCPNCQKEFPDSMRFCQTDGTPLVEAVSEIQAEDPLKTTVVRQEDIASAIPASDPFKTVVGGMSDAKDDDDDLLQLPQEFDPLKTMVVAPNVGQEKPILENLTPEKPKFEEIKEEIKLETPASSWQPDKPIASPFDQPEPPKFSDPVVPAPSFQDFSAKDEKADDDLPATILQNQFDAGSFSKPETPPSSFEMSEPPKLTPIPSPFDAPQSNFEQPKVESPMFGGGQQSSFDDPPKPFEAPQSPFQATPFETPKPNLQKPQAAPFETPSTNYAPVQETANQPFQNPDWNPPPAPMQGWQDQGLGANTPFQPPVVGAQNQTLAIVSLVCGLLALPLLIGMLFPFVGIVCMIGSFGLGVGAIVTGFLARSKANNFPDQYAGGGLAIGGIISGGLAVLAIIGLFLLAFVFGAIVAMS